jgi:hypothetical protein
MTMTTALAPEVRALLDRTRTPQRDHMLTVQELRQSNAAAPHRVRRPGDPRVRGTRRQTRQAAIRASMAD